MIEVRFIAEAVVQQGVIADPVGIPPSQRFASAFIQDSTTIALPDALTEVRRGGRDAAERGVAVRQRVSQVG